MLNVPEGQNENSPAFQRRERLLISPSHGGTAEVQSPNSAVPPGLVAFKSDPGVETLGYFHQVPSGQKARKTVGTPEGFVRAQNALCVARFHSQPLPFFVI